MQLKHVTIYPNIFGHKWKRVMSEVDELSVV